MICTLDQVTPVQGTLPEVCAAVVGERDQSPPVRSAVGGDTPSYFLWEGPGNVSGPYTLRELKQAAGLHAVPPRLGRLIAQGWRLR